MKHWTVYMMLLSCLDFSSNPALEGEDADEGKKSPLDAKLDLYRSVVELGVPLVVRVTITNRGDRSIRTSSYRSEFFKNSAAVGFEISKSLGEGESPALVASREAVSSHAVRLLDFDSVEDLRDVRGIDLPLLHPGGVIETEKVILPVGESGMLPPGEYAVIGCIDIGVGNNLRTTPQSFEIVDVGNEQRTAVETLENPQFISLVEGKWGKPTTEMSEKVLGLKAKYPALTHWMYLDYRLLEGRNTLADYRVAAFSYIREYEKSPFADDVLFRIGELAIREGRIEDARQSWESLLKTYPKSVLKSETKRKLQAVEEVTGK